ncbi:MAG TPA: hypothetical protein VFV78_06585 [Vicinamibacterales bacterium]|nr:hypothetical protein [Vicinamibacterales bacterium]
MTHRYRSTVLLLLLVGLAWASPARAQVQYGVRAGVSADPDQFFVGGHIETRPLISNLSFRPNVEIGWGDSMTALCFNFEFAYRFYLDQKPFNAGAKPWWIYVGGGPAAVYSHVDNGGSDFGGGFNFLAGVQHRKGLFAEIKGGVGDSPDFKFAVGYAWK